MVADSPPPHRRDRRRQRKILGVTTTDSKAQAPNTTWARLFWRVAIGTGVPFGISMIFVQFIFGSRLGWIWTVGLGCAVGGLFGLGMAAFLVPLSRRLSGSASAPPVCQVRELELPCTRDETMKRAAEALAHLPGSGQPTIDIANGTAAKVTGRSWKSWGEEVLIQIEAHEGTTCRVRVVSRPRMRATLVDYGVNAKNADLVEAALRA